MATNLDAAADIATGALRRNPAAPLPQSEEFSPFAAAALARA
mgnify:FL=1